MQFPLNQFEESIDNTIVERGLSYFENGYVHEPVEIQSGVFEAIVEGSDDYTVHLRVSDGVVTESDCDCPYDIGPVCKHIVAVLYCLRKEVADVAKHPDAPKRIVVSELADEILEKLTHEELKQFVREKLVKNTDFRDLFLSAFVPTKTDNSHEFYVKQVKSILRESSKRDGYIDWSASNEVGFAVGDILESAKEQIETRNYKTAVFICMAVLDQMYQAFEYADDSNGSIGGCVDSAYEMLSDIAEQELDEEVRKLIIDYCFDAYDQKRFSGWDWHIGMLCIASSLLKTNEEADQIFAKIETSQFSNYEKEAAGKLMFDVLEKIQGEEAAWNYLEQNISNPTLRRKAIEKAFTNEDYARATEVAQDGVECDQKSAPGQVIDWNDWLLKISQAQSDTAKIIEYSRLLFITSFRRDNDYYALLKQNVDPDKWHTFVEDIVNEISATTPRGSSVKIANIFINEEWWDRLFELLKKSPDISTIDNYVQYLSRDYAAEIAEMYAHAIVKSLKNTSTRDHYKNACRNILKIKKLGESDNANRLIAFLRAEYPRRKALMEELSLI